MALGLHACDGCWPREKFAPFDVHVKGTIPGSHTPSGQPERVDDDVHLCAYCKADLEDLGLEVTEL